MTRQSRPARRGVLAGPAAFLCLLCTAAGAEPDNGIAAIDIGRMTAESEATLRRVLRDRSYLLLQDADGTAKVWILSPAPDDVRAALGTLRHDGSALQSILQALADPDPLVREEAVLGLVDTRDAAAIDLVSQSLHDDSALVRAAAAAVLDELGATDYLPPDRPMD